MHFSLFLWEKNEPTIFVNFDFITKVKLSIYAIHTKTVPTKLIFFVKNYNKKES